MRLINKKKLSEEAAKSKSENINTNKEQTTSTPTAASPGTYEDSNNPNDNTNTNTTPNPSNTTSSILDQDKECQNILKLKDYYDILGIAKNSDENEIKKAYKKVN
jgi:hypothetical protein